MYSLTIKNLEVDDKTVILCALLSQQARYTQHAKDLVALKSSRVSVEKLAQSYFDDAERIQRILNSVYNARSELQPERRCGQCNLLASEGHAPGCPSPSP